MARPGETARSVDERAALLRGHFLLQHLAEDDIRRLAAVAAVARFKAHEPIFRQGGRETDLMILLSGQVKLGATSAEGRELLANFAEPGHVFGEIAVIDGRPRSYDATASQASEVLIVRRADLIPFLEERPQLCIRLMAALCERVRRSETLVQDALFLRVGPRLARQLLRLAELHGIRQDGGVRIDMKVNQGDLANLVGMTRESINKQLCAWRRDGLVAFRGKSYTLSDPEALRRIAEPGD